MVFEVRDARIPFSSANDDLDKIVGPSKARLVVLNKVNSITWKMFGVNSTTYCRFFLRLKISLFYFRLRGRLGTTSKGHLQPRTVIAQFCPCYLVFLRLFYYSCLVVFVGAVVCLVVLARCGYGYLCYLSS